MSIIILVPSPQTQQRTPSRRLLGMPSWQRVPNEWNIFVDTRVCDFSKAPANSGDDSLSWHHEDCYSKDLLTYEVCV
jgi:hypothetical protein